MTSKLAFWVISRGKGIKVPSGPYFALLKDNWDDFGYKVQFHLSYVNATGTSKRLGSVKILQRTSAQGESTSVALTTELPETFFELDDAFVSLGQEEEYYKELNSNLTDEVGEVLSALRDIAWQPALASDFEPTSGFRNALMRENGANRSRRFGRSWASGDNISEDFEFNYTGTIEGADAPTEARFEFNGKDVIPGRIVGIIGRNAVGKTRFLASLGADLAQISRTSAERLAEREERFRDGRPLFTRVIAISYSAFDKFKRPPLDSSSSYVYCGIRNDKGGLSRTSLVEAYRKNQARIRERDMESDWTEHMQTILGDLGNNLTASLKAEIQDTAKDDTTLSLLSSGQSILAHFVTALLAWIQPNSLVLFDEPETHLHPNAVASLFLVLADILRKFDSYAVVATHSPVVIQEIPAKRVIMFQRENNVTSAHPLMLESFGESVTELTRHVFETIEVERVYRRTLKRLAAGSPAENVLALFEHGLSPSAQAYLLAQYGKRSGEAK